MARSSRRPAGPLGDENVLDLLPVVATRLGCTPEVAGDAALLVDPRDPEQIAAAIDHVLADRRLHDALAERGLQQARRFSWQRCARQTLDLFESLVGAPAVGNGPPRRRG